MKNIRGALFVLSLSIVLLFNSTTIAQSKAPTLWLCGSGQAVNYLIIRFHSFEFLTKFDYNNPRSIFRGSREDLKKIEAKILKERNCFAKIEKQSYTRLYKKISSSGGYKANKEQIRYWSRFSYKEKSIKRDTFLKLSKKYNEYPLKNLASTTQTQQVAKKKEPSQTQQVVNINAEAKTKIDLSFCKVSDYNIFAALTDRFYNDCTRDSGNKISYQRFLQSRMKHICFNTRTKNVMSRQLPCVKDLGHSKVFYENGSFYYNTIETQIAKKEPKKKEKKVAKKENIINLIFCENKRKELFIKNQKFGVRCPSSHPKKITYKKFKNLKPNYNLCSLKNSMKIQSQPGPCNLLDAGRGKTLKYDYDKENFYYLDESIKTQIAKKENIKVNQNLIDKYFGDNSPKILIFVIVLLGIPIIGIFILKSKSKQKTKPFARAATSGAINQYAWKGKKILKYKNWGVIVPVIVVSIWFGEKYYNANPDKAIQQAKQVAQTAKKTGQDWKCKLFDVCPSEEKTQQVAKKIINIYCVKNNYSAIRIEKGEKPNCKNGEFKVVKNEYLLLETVYDNLASYFDLNDPNEVVLFDSRVRDIFKITHQDFNKLTDTQQVAKIEKTKKRYNLIEQLFQKEEKKITTKEVLDLGKYTEFNTYPEGMLKEFKQCKKMYCRGKIAGKKVYEIFARRGELWHQRHPGDIIHGMAWFEIFYLEKLRKNEKQIARYIKNGPEGYSSKMKMSKDISSLHGLIKTNKGRIKMREALGLSLNDNLETVLKRHWLLGDFLNKDKLKVKRVAIGSDMKKRKELLAKYKSALTRYKNKLDEERRATN